MSPKQGLEAKTDWPSVIIWLTPSLSVRHIPSETLSPRKS